VIRMILIINGICAAGLVVFALVPSLRPGVLLFWLLMVFAGAVFWVCGKAPRKHPERWVVGLFLNLVCFGITGAMTAGIIVAGRTGPQWRDSVELFEQICNDTRPLIAEAKEKKVEPGSVVLVGKALVWDAASKDPETSVKLPPELKTRSTDREVTVFILVDHPRREIAPAYADQDVPIYRVLRDVCIVYWPSKEIVGKVTIVAEPDPQRVGLTKRGEGDIDETIGEWIQSLPRRSTAEPPASGPSPEAPDAPDAAETETGGT